MANITWRFIDEQGTNLNRYIATNVDTGEEITFDLLRGGNISVVGTPLNAEKLNEIIEALNNSYTKLETNTKINTSIKEYMTANYENGNTGAY